MRKFWTVVSFTFICTVSSAQQDTLKKATDSSVMFIDTIKLPEPDTLRIINLNPFFSVHVDSSLFYQFQINKNISNYFWYLKNAPVGLRINKDNGLLTFKADKSYFLSGRLKYDFNYNVSIGVQNLSNPAERVDTVFKLVFYNTEIIPSRLKPTINGTVWIEEAETVRFKVLCETGNFPFENILTATNVPIGAFTPVQRCNDEFMWVPSYDFVKETDSGKVKIVTISFIGSTKFKLHDTAQVKFIVRNSLNYPLAKEQYNQLVKDMNGYILRLKYSFLQLDRGIKKTKKARTAFDLTAASAALTGTILSTSTNSEAKRTGLILPGIGVVISPIKEAAAPNKNAEQNQATLLRSSIKRLEYVVQDNRLVGDKDPEFPQKMARLKEELKQSQLQLIDVPIEMSNNLTEEELNRYFNSIRVNKKYNLKK